jgi:hypothetical protein
MYVVQKYAIVVDCVAVVSATDSLFTAEFQNRYTACGQLANHCTGHGWNTHLSYGTTAGSLM